MASSTASASKKKGRAYRGWITAEEIAAEGADLGNRDAMAVDEDGKPYVKHTSKAKHKEAQAAVRAVFFRQTAGFVAVFFSPSFFLFNKAFF